jgi:uncharacterized protein YkwD
VQWGTALLATVLVFLADTGAQAAPSVNSVRLDRGAVVNRPIELRVRGSDPAAAVGTLVTRFGGGGQFGLSACLPPDSQGRPAGGPFAPGSRVTLSAPHTYTRTGARRGLIRVDSGNCEGGGGSVLQPFTVTPVRRGQRPRPLVLGTPIPLPGTGPGAPTLPDLPGIGDLPPLPPLPDLPLARASSSRVLHDHGAPGLLQRAVAARASCPNSRRRVRRRRSSRRAARFALLCLINRQRNARGLRSLRHNRRLFTAGFRHSRSMVRRRYFSHFGPGGVNLSTRLRRVRYLPARTWRVGENLGYGRGRGSSPTSVIRAWMHSTPHRAILLNRNFREVGLGVFSGVPARGGGATYTADFGIRR